MAICVCILHFAFCNTGASAQSLVPVGARQLVMPFENATREPRYNWLGEGCAFVLTDDLIALGAQTIARDDRLRAFEHLRVPPASMLSEATVIRIGQVLGAEQIITGSFAVEKNIVVVRARAIRLDTGRRFAEIRESGPLTDFFAIFAKVARRLLPESAVTTDAMESGHPPLAAFEQYIKGVIAENPATQVVFLKEALRLAPEFQRIRLALWQVYTDQGEHQQALEIARQVPAAHPRARAARFRGALSLLHLGRHAEAIDAFTSLNIDQPDAALLNNLGVAQLRRTAKSPDLSPIDFFQQAVTASPDPDIVFNLGYAAWLGHDNLTAVRWLREAVRRNPADHAAHWVLGVALQASMNAAEGQREKDLARRLSSSYAEWETKPPAASAIPPSLERIKTELDAGNSPRVEQAIAAAEQRDQREQATFHLESGRRLYEAQRDSEAIAELRRAIYLSPYDREAHLLLGRVYLRAGQIADAIDELKISIWSDDRSDARNSLAEAYIRAKDVDAARSELRTVLTREPSNAEARRLMDRLRLVQ